MADDYATILIRPDGTVEAVEGHAGAEVLAGIPEVAETLKRRRASHVEPVSFWFRLAFHVVWRIVRDDSPAAEWTRAWACRWRVNVVGGPTWGAYQSRAAAIAAEVEWLESRQQ